ncbi:hypothetical protein [Pseudoxanthomonas sp.]|uniref:hypothetical protein n=1 Tax=Pseudoxanthomonas sp. TaxID=1871049 RepID=UPI002E14E15B
MSDVYVGLTGLELASDAIDLGEGVLIQRTSARFLTPLTLENPDKTVRLEDIRPAYWQFGARRMDITAELKLSSAGEPDIAKCIERASIIVLTIRLWCDPSVTMAVVADRPFGQLTEMRGNDHAKVFPLEVSPRFFALEPANREQMAEKLEWVQQNWVKAEVLYRQSQEFRLAADALSAGQFIKNDALALISLWGALEALFSPSTSELKFRVSALIAAYLEPLGPARLAKQKEIGALYDKRSAAAHGKPRHNASDLLSTFDLVRTVLLRMVREEKIPSKQKLEELLFGCS